MVAWALGIVAAAALCLWLAAWRGQAEYRTAVNLAKQGRHRQAVGAFTRAHLLRPGDPWVLAGRGIAQRDVRNYDLALRDFDAALRLLTDTDRRATAIYCARADAYHQMGRYAKAISDYARAVKRDPTDARACNNLAWLLATCRDPQLRRGELAMQFAVAANRQTGWTHADYLDTLAAACATAGKSADAARWARAAAARTTNPAAKTALLRRAHQFAAGKVLVETQL
ncbi:MAG TPA: tetratricopeptide repeat protein [Armatimonadota bacterium]|nr:tetratricopeptide repeat protein [Armatimonadota bacterium]HOS42962.1 tetratricopeptide repeat protein [Armatimonadota bacterium]